MEDSLNQDNKTLYDIFDVSVTDSFFQHLLDKIEKARPSYRHGARAGLCIQAEGEGPDQELEFSSRSSSSTLFSMLF